MNDYCYGFVCFVPLNANAPKFFGFSEFLAALALMVLAWTIADVRYRFRIRTAPPPLPEVTFAVVGAVGILTLLTDLWRAEQLLVPRGNLLTPSAWQAILGGLFFMTFLIWVWFAFMRPPVYGKWNTERYAQVFYRTILKGSSSELSVIADEFTRSVRALIQYATVKDEMKDFLKKEEKTNEKSKDPPKVTSYADGILLLIADKKFCRAIVESSSDTALAIFQEIGETKKYSVQIDVFAKNILHEALANKDSFLFYETEGYESGLIGYHKPLSQAMFSNYSMVEVIGTLLDPDIREQEKWDATQWKAYCRIVLITFRDYVEKGYGGHSFVLFRAKGYIEHAVSDLYKIDGISNIAWNDDIHERLRVIVKFVKDAIEILDKKGVSKYLRLRVRDKNGPSTTFYDYLAAMIFEIISSASTVKSPIDLCWWIQHNSVWGEFFNFGKSTGAAAKVVQFKVRRLLYDGVIEMNDFPNFQAARILRFCLNVMHIRPAKEDYFRDSMALQKAILSWTKKNYARLHSYNPQIAEACLVEGITYEAENLRLVKTYPAGGLRREPEYIYFNVDLPAPEVVKIKNVDSVLEIENST